MNSLDMKMPFGKYKDSKLKDIPVMYFTTLLQYQTIDPDLLKHIMVRVHTGIKAKLSELEDDEDDEMDMMLNMPAPGSYDDWQDDWR